MADKLLEFVDPFATTSELPEFVDPFATAPKEEEGFTDAVLDAFDPVVDAVSTVGSIGRGVLNAPISIAGGLAETAALVVDFGLGTNTASKVENTFDAIKEVTGSKTKAGQITDDVVSFGASFLIPALWVSKATSIARGIKTGKGLMGFAPKSKIGKNLDKLAVKFGNSASGKALLTPKVLGVRPGQVLATAAGTAPISFLVSPSGRPTLSDSVDWMPDLTETDQQQVQGRDETTRRFKNKLKNSLEDTAMGGAFDVGLGLGLGLAKGVGIVGSAALKSKPVRPVVEKTKEISKRVYDAGLKDSLVENFAKRNLTSFRGLNPKTANEIELGLQPGKEVDRISYMADADFDMSARQVLKDSLRDSKLNVDGINVRLKETNKRFIDLDAEKKLINVQSKELTDELIELSDQGLSTSEIVARTNPKRIDIDEKLAAIKKEQESIGLENKRLETLKRNKNKKVSDKDADKPEYGKSTFTMSAIKADVEDVFSGKKTVYDIDYLSPELGRSIERMQLISARGTDDLVSVLEEEIAIAPLNSLRAQKSQEALDIIKENRENNVTHIRRLFQRYEDPVAFYKQLKLDSPEYKQTVDDMSQHMFDNNLYVPGATVDEMRTIAEDEVRNMLGLAATSSGLGSKELIKKVKREIRLADTLADDGSVLVARIPKFKQATDILESRTKFLDKSKAAQQLLKIIDEDPIGIWRKTVNDTANLVATRDFYRSQPIASLSDARQMLQQGGRPMIVRPPGEVFMDSPAALQRVKPGQEGYRPGLADSAQPSQRDVLEEQMKELEGYVKLGDESAERVFGGQFGELSGMYVAPEFYQSITAPYKLRNTAADFILSMFQKARAGSQKVTVVPSITANVRQMYGNGMMLGSNANLGADNVSLALRTQIARYADLEDEGLEYAARKLSAAGVADENVILRTLKEYREAGKEFSFLEAPNRLFDKAGDALGMRYFEKFYSGTDTVAKGAALFGEEGKLLDVFNAARIPETEPSIHKAFVENKLFSGAGLELQGAGKRRSFTRLTPVEQQAAEVVKDTMPTYNRIVEAAKFVDKIPIVGNFTSFAAENTRNAFNTVTRGFREMGFEVSPAIRQELLTKGFTEKQISAFEKGIRGNGAQRVAAFAAVNSILPKQLVKMSMRANGLSEEDYQAILESSVPDYLKEAGHDIMILDTYGPGRYQAIDLSYTFPYAYLSDVANAAVATYQKQGKLGKGNIEAGARAALNGIYRFGEPFTQETMVFERIMDVAPEDFPGGRVGKTKSMGTVYGGADDGWDIARKSILHVLGGFMPEYTRLILTEKNGDVKAGRLSKTVFGMESRQGVKGQYHDPYVEAMRLVSGFTPMELDSRTALEFSGKEYAGNRSDVRTSANVVLGNMESSERQIMNRWGDYLDALYREQSKLYLEIQNMKRLGLDNREIRQQLVRDAKLGSLEAGRIIKGQFAPGNATVDTISAMRQEQKTEGGVRRTPLTPKLVGELNSIVKERANTPLKYVSPDEDLPEFIDPFEESSAAPVIQENTVPIMPTAMVNPAPAPAAPPVSTLSAQVDPTLLGGDPATQALAKSLGRV